MEVVLVVLVVVAGSEGAAVGVGPAWVGGLAGVYSVAAGAELQAASASAATSTLRVRWAPPSRIMGRACTQSL
jgi:hypothetical protein